MGKLDDLRGRLFRTREKFMEREGEPDLTPTPAPEARAWTGDEDPAVLERIMKAREQRMRRFAFWSVIILAVVAISVAGAAVFYLGRVGSVTERNILLEIKAPEKIVSGTKVEFTVRFKNINTIPLESVDLIFEYPIGARPVFGEPPRGRFRERIPIGRLEPGEEREQPFEAFLFGKELDVLMASATLEYRPSNTSARFGKDTAFAIMVERSPIGVSVSIPGEVNIGQEVDVVVHYVSSAETVFQNVSLDVQYPQGFTFLTADPAPTRDDHIWRLGDLAPGVSGTITIRGTIAGLARETKHIDARMGLLDEETNTWTIFAEASNAVLLRTSLLAVEGAINGSREYIGKFGDAVTFTFAWQNNLPVTVQHGIIEVDVSGKALDFTSLRVTKGTFDGVNQRVVWNASSEPELRSLDPGETGTVSFTARVLLNPPVAQFTDKDFVVTASALITSSIMPEGYEGVDIRGRDTVAFNVSSRMGLASRGQYFSSLLPNTGPLPPRLGQETTYAITWSLTNSSSDVEGVSVRSSIPAYMRWKQLTNPAGEKISYNPDTGEIVWDTGFVVAGTGFTRPAREVSFQLGLVPGVDLVGKTPDILFSTTARGRDVFTGVTLEAVAGDVSTAIRSDTQVTPEQYRVTN